jgi:hypothetical protein
MKLALLHVKSVNCANNLSKIFSLLLNVILSIRLLNLRKILISRIHYALHIFLCDCKEAFSCVSAVLYRLYLGGGGGGGRCTFLVD